MPSTRRHKKLKARSQNTLSLPIHVDELQHGSIYFLPSKAKCENRSVMVTDLHIDDGCNHHPVLVFATHRATQNVLALVVGLHRRRRLSVEPSNLKLIAHELWRKKRRNEIS